MLSARIKTGPGRGPAWAATGSQPVSLSMSFTWQHRPEPGPGTQTPSGPCTWPGQAQLGLVSLPCLPIARSPACLPAFLPACLPCSLLPASRSCDPLPNVRDRLRLCLVIFFLPFLPCKNQYAYLTKGLCKWSIDWQEFVGETKKTMEVFKYICFILQKTLIHTC